jgi:hypothetical protein
VAEARELLVSLHNWVQRADMKASILIASVTAGGSFEIAALAGAVQWARRGGSGRYAVVAVLGLSVAFALVSWGLAIASIYPRLGPEYHWDGTAHPGDLVYFGRLRKIPPGSIAEALERGVADGSLLAHYAEQLQRNAESAWTKHRALQRSLDAFAAAGVTALIAFLIWISLGV